jgi:hypothetical protein
VEPRLSRQHERVRVAGATENHGARGRPLRRRLGGLGRQSRDTSESAIRGQIFNANGSKYGGEFLVNTSTNFAQNTPEITAFADGKFTVTWTDASGSAGDTNGEAVRAQMFNNDGSRYGGEILVNTSTGGLQYGRRSPALTTAGSS